MSIQVTTDIKRSDLVRFNLAILPGIKSVYINILSIAVIVFAYISWNYGFPQSGNDWLATLAGAAGGGVGGVLAGIVISFISILVSSSTSNGILGKHEYRVSNDGLYEVTSANEGLSKWEGIQEVKVVGSYILFRISGYLYHIIPKRSFLDEEEFQAFVYESLGNWENAHNQAG